MGEKTGIGWCDHTWNPWKGCHKVTEECRFCYIEGVLKRCGVENPFGGPSRCKTWGAPIKWNRAAIEDDAQRRVFTCSLSDWFHPGADQWRAEAWRIVRDCKNLTWLILTKRPELIADRLPADWGDGYENVWLGATVGHTQSYKRLPELRDIPARLKFISAEPLLEDLDFREHLGWIDWIITGCEQAGKDKRRHMNMQWVRNIDQQCRDAGVAHYFKQYYACNADGEEIGVPVTDGVLDGHRQQRWPQ
tara:strand:+ start:8147 stop:8890 length:744 start_codon:yes stop_codon:yes gene_type:complete